MPPRGLPPIIILTGGGGLDGIRFKLRAGLPISLPRLLGVETTTAVNLGALVVVEVGAVLTLLPWRVTDEDNLSPIIVVQDTPIRYWRSSHRLVE